MRYFDKQHYLMQAQYIRQCIMNGEPHGLKEIIVDNFAGGGGASTGIEIATGYSVYAAINHDPEAIRMHMANHPDTKHYCESVWDVNPLEICNGNPVGLAWFSPDCKHFSKAKGGKPKDKNIRGLAWVALRWAGLVRPRVLMLENVEEFRTWGPLNRRHHPIKKKKGATFNRFVKQLEALGYAVEFRELTAADYGAPTRRKRLFMIARCDGLPIKWPEPAYGPRDSIEVAKGLRKPYIPASDIIDWSIPCPSIFGRKRPLAENTMRRIAKGLKKFVFENPEPFLVQVEAERMEPVRAPYIMCNNANNVGGDINNPVPTITTGNRNFLISPTLIQYHTETADEIRGQDLTEPIMTIDGANRYGLVSAFIHKYFGGSVIGAECTKPLPIITATDHNSLCAVHIIQAQGQSIGTDIREPLNTMTGVNHMGEVMAFLVKYYGTCTGQEVTQLLDTVTCHGRFGLVEIQGALFQIVDIGLRMLQPHELYAAQGFPGDYIIDRDVNGRKISKTEQVQKCGNSVCPPIPAALVSANLPELCKAERLPICRPDRMLQETSGQLRFA